VIRKGRLLCLGLVIVFAFLACGSPQGRGDISGRLVYGQFDQENPQEGMPNVRVVLCRLDKRLPEGPVVSDLNEGKLRRLGVLLAAPTAVTDSDGRFTLQGVPAGSYLLLVDLLPAAPRPPESEWDGTVLTTADVDQTFQGIPSSGKADFWKEGGLISGRGDWNSTDGFVLKAGMVSSKSLGFFFSVRDKLPHPIVDVQADSTAEVVLTSHILPGKVDR
jgi:hypothetical protein